MPDRDPTPREEAALRRLLRDARHDGPVPPDVAARTEETLASLGAGAPGEGDTSSQETGSRETGSGAREPRGAAVAGGPDHHRRRRAATALLVAAVSVVVVGIGIGQVVRPAADQASEGAASSSAGSTARDTPPDRAGNADEESAGEDSALPDALSEGAAPQEGAARAFSGGVAVERLALVDDPPSVRETRFARDVRQVRALQQEERRVRAPATADRSELATRDPAPGFSCPRTDVGAGRPVAVRYEAAPAVLVLRPATRATQVVDLVECGSGDVIRSVTLPR